MTDLVGHVAGCDCIIVDDMIDTAATLCTAANELTSLGARRVFAFATHGLFSGSAAERIEVRRRPPTPLIPQPQSRLIPLDKRRLTACPPIRVG